LKCSLGTEDSPRGEGKGIVLAPINPN
jgi:hypothetical protein